MAAKLIIEEGDLKGLSLSLEEGDAWTIGRDPAECQLVLEDPLVSQKHLIARRSPEGIVAENLSETHPVLLNDKDMDAQPHLLQNGDTLKVGNEVLRFYEESSAPAPSQDDRPDDLAEFDDIDNPPEQEGELDLPQEAHPEADSQTPTPEPPPPAPEPPHQDTLFGEGHDEANPLAEIDFGFIETGRWLLKVIGGPNSGAEFYMHAGNSYVIGTDPQSCDIVFHDTSVSRQHARITVTPEDSLSIEDLKSRNGVLINGALIEEKQELSQGTIVTLGTTSFAVYDREGEMETIISPLIPSFAKVLQQESAKEEAPPESAQPGSEPTAEELTAPSPQTVEAPKPPKPRQFGPYIVLSAIIGLFVLAGIGTSTLFHEEPVVVQTQENANELIQQALNSFPSVRWTFNKSNGSLLLLGHVTTGTEKNRLMYQLGNLKFIKSIDDSGIIIDEGVLGEVNSLIAHNPEWKGIRVYSPEAGHFILSGELKSRKQAEQLSSYLSLNFPYIDLLKKQVIVEEDVLLQTQAWLRSAQLPDVTVKMNNAEVILGGSYPPDKANQLNEVFNKVKQIPGIHTVFNEAQTQTAETGVMDITQHYPVTGKSRLGNKFTVVINGRIVSEGDELDGMTITKITANQVLLQKDKDKFRIDY